MNKALVVKAVSVSMAGVFLVIVGLAGYVAVTNSRLEKRPTAPTEALVFREGKLHPVSEAITATRKSSTRLADQAGRLLR